MCGAVRRVVASYVRRCGGGVRLPAAAGALLLTCRRVHERPFLELPPDVTQSEAYEVARDALLQLNVMVRRGIEPDALMYTSLIATMGRAKLEWQAYKLFSRMLEHGVRPLPETYVALHDATSPTRRRLRDDLQMKIEESLESFPDELAEAELARQHQQDILCVQRFEEYMKGVLPPPEQVEVAVSRSSGSIDAQQKGRSTATAGAAEEPIATMHIRNPTDVWSTARMMEQQQGRGAWRASGESAESLADQLHRLHEEELRIYLAAQRQLRHGSKDELVRRVLDTVTEQSIREMLARRKHYFGSVAQILENDLNALRQAGESGVSNSSNGHKRSGAETHPRAPAADRTLTTAEKETVAAEVLHTPWGILRKPMKRQPDAAAPRDAERLERVNLTMDELQLVRSKGETGDLDELPESLLRRYASEFNLSWRRKHPLSLLEAVQWHCTTFLPERLDGKVVVRPTAALRRQQEDEGVQKTLENYEAFRIISQRTNNLQVVDKREINLHLKRVQRDARQKECRAEETLRRERHLLDAATLAASAKSYRPPDEPLPAASHVLGVNGDNSSSSSNNNGEQIPPLGDTDDASATLQQKQEEESGELPPWAVFAGEEEFDISTGRFGDPDMGRYQELSDGRFKVLPSREAQRKWDVDRQLLPGPLQDELNRAELQQQLQKERVETEYGRRLQYKRYRKWDAFLRKAQEKRQKEKVAAAEDDNDAVQPLPPKRRLAYLLRKGHDKAPVEEAVKAKYTKSL